MKSKQKTIVGLDIEAGSIAATEVSVNGRVEITGHALAPLDPGVFREGEVADPGALGSALKTFFSEHKLSRNVRLGIANQRIAVRTLHLPPIDKDSELEAAIRFQAQDQIPMPLDQAVLDWDVIGRTTGANGEPRVDAVAVAARRDMLAQSLKALRAGGLRPVGIDLSAFGMIRALAGVEHPPVGAAEYVEAPVVPYEERAADERGVAAPVPEATAPLPEPPPPSYEERPAAGAETAEAALEAHVPAKLYCNLGDLTNLAVAQGSSCLFTRISPFGIEGIAQRLAERQKLTLEHARQWLVHVGYDAAPGEIEGEPETIAAAREALAEGGAKLADELRLSLEYYGAQEGAVAVETVVACGPGMLIPGLVERLQKSLGLPFQVGRPQALAHLDAAAASRLTLSYGLALEG